MRSTTAAAMAAALAGFACVPPQASAHGFTDKQIRNLVKREVAKVKQGPRGPAGSLGSIGPTGPAGPAGPAGMDGFPSLFARLVYGEVDAGRSVGITQENVRTEETLVPDDQGRTLVSTTYCFIDLPPVMGGQVTTDGHEGSGDLVSPKLQMNPFDGECPIRVFMRGLSQFAAPPESFYILLY